MGQRAVIQVVYIARMTWWLPFTFSLVPAESRMEGVFSD